MSPAPRPGPRERLLSSARELTYSRGIAVGVNAILEDADVARGSLYQHFNGKEDLLAETLRQSAEVSLERYRQALDRGGTNPRSRLLAMFDEMDKQTSATQFRGCRFAAADLGLPDPEHPAHQATRDYRHRLREILLDELRALPHAEPERSADQLLLLIDGTLMAAASRPDSHPALAARELAALLLDAN